LLSPDQILEIKNAFVKAGFGFSSDCEITLEINPATLDDQKVIKMVELGVNRFSVGAQTFDDRRLKQLGRKHNSAQTIETLNLLNSLGVSISFDLLFALPDQTVSELDKDLQKILLFNPGHVSLYCLTVPSNNPLYALQPTDEVQESMFKHVWKRLADAGYKNYEISNFAKPGMESVHNMLYWQDQPYWGVGLSAHSYIKTGPWGERFWNSRSLNDYCQWVDTKDELPSSQREILNSDQSLSDYCHTALRIKSGLSLTQVTAKYGVNVEKRVNSVLTQLRQEGLLESEDNSQYRLSDKGILLSNLVFEKLTFSTANLD
jgi:oxygen-independent coproporphyrinogen-3 oxidase